MQNAPREHSAILLTFIKLPFVLKTFVLPIFEWALKTGFTVYFPIFHKKFFFCYIVVREEEISIVERVIDVLERDDERLQE